MGTVKCRELSKGAKLELDVASSCGIKVLFE